MFCSPPPLPVPPTWKWWNYIFWEMMELLLRPSGNFSPPFSGGRGLVGAGSQGTNCPPPMEQIQFPPLVKCCVNTLDGGCVYLHLWLGPLFRCPATRAETGTVTDACKQHVKGCQDWWQKKTQILEIITIDSQIKTLLSKKKEGLHI